MQASQPLPRGKTMQDFPVAEYDLLDLLDRLEELLEDLDEFGITSRAEAETLMAQVRQRLDDLEGPSDS